MTSAAVIKSGGEFSFQFEWLSHCIYELCCYTHTFQVFAQKLGPSLKKHPTNKSPMRRGGKRTEL